MQAAKVKVCHFSSVHHVWDTRVFYRECISLAKEFDVTLIAIGNRTENLNGVNIIGIKKPANIFIRFFFTIFKVFILAVKQNAQIYHIHDAEMVPFGIALRILGKKVIYDIHENTYDDILLKPWLNKSFRLLIAKSYNCLLLFASRFIHYIVVVADPKYLTKFFVNEHECTIIQNFANTDELSDFVLEDRASLPGNHLFYVGMIRDMYYNIDPVIEAIYLLKQKGIVCHLHLIGYFGSKTNHSLATVPCYTEVKDQINYYGFLDINAAYKIARQCKIGLCIKDQPESMLVSHERKLFEYMAIGLPSIFCNSSIYKELNNQWQIGIGVQLKNSEEIAKAIEALLTNPIELNKLAINNLKAARTHFSWQLESNKLLGLYHQLLV
jgi:glycosyltransferase involved in cell wall biosynthesis